MEKYNVLAFIGEGSFGRVFKVKNKETDGIFALKVIRKKGRSSRDLKNLRQECDIQQHLRHPNIIRMFESFDTESELFVVTEFAEKELHGILGKEGCLQESKAQVLTWDLVSALYYLHSHRVLHRDLKPQNVLLDAKGNAKLCDFGLARNMTTGTHVLTSIKGTPLYMAPELIDEKPYDHQADLWSLGCIVYEMIAGQPPFSTTSIVQLVSLIRHRPVQWPSYISSDARSFLKGLLHKDPSLRFSWQEILVHPFVSGHILILPEQTPTESPFTQPLSQSQKAAKQLQKERLKRCVPEAVQILERREKMKPIPAKLAGLTDGVAVSDDDSIRVVSAASVRDSLRTDDEDVQLITGAHAVLLKHEFNVLNQDNLIISNLNTNMAELALQPRSQMPTVNENKEMVAEKPTDLVTEKPKESLLDKKLCNTDSNKLEENKFIDDHNDPNKRKLSQNLDNFSIKIKSSTKAAKDSPLRVVAQSVDNTHTEKQINLAKETILSKSVPPSYKQKLLQFSRDKLGFGSGNRLTRSLKKSFHLSKSDKEKVEKGRRMSEPVELAAAQVCPIGNYEEKGDEKTDEKCDKSIPKIDENLKLCDISSNDGQSFIDDDSVPIESEEWLAFMRSNMKEVMEGDVESLTQQNIVSMVVGVARHAGAGAEVRGSLAALLSLPLVGPHVPRQTISTILKVYLEIKLVPNLVYAGRLLIRQSAAENNTTDSPVRNLSNEEMLALCRLTELTTQLCLRGAPFVHQLCDAVAVLNMPPFLAQYLSLHDKRLRIVLNTITMLTVILQDAPENAELVESVLFENPCVNVCDLLLHSNETLKIRVCVFIGLLARYCCRALCSAWNKTWGAKQRDVLEKLHEHSNDTLSRAAKCASKDLCKLPFYSQNCVKR